METASYGFLKGIDYVLEECPMSVDATSLVYKEALSLLEDEMPGTRSRFYHGFLNLRTGTFLRTFTGGEGRITGSGAKPEEAERDEAGEAPGRCAACGSPSFAETCSYCRLREKVLHGRTKAGGR